jgi:hypothetical protein
VACKGLRRGACRVFVGRPKGKRPPGRPKHRWEGNIKVDLREIQINELWGWEVGGNGSELCPLRGFGVKWCGTF